MNKKDNKVPNLTQSKSQGKESPWATARAEYTQRNLNQEAKLQ